jgi:hypothetical protein
MLFFDAPAATRRSSPSASVSSASGRPPTQSPTPSGCPAPTSTGSNPSSAT